jgi:hypothetical protein
VEPARAHTERPSPGGSAKRARVCRRRAASRDASGRPSCTAKAVSAIGPRAPKRRNVFEPWPSSAGPLVRASSPLIAPGAAPEVRRRLPGRGARASARRASGARDGAPIAHPDGRGARAEALVPDHARRGSLAQRVIPRSPDPSRGLTFSACPLGWSRTQRRVSPRLPAVSRPANSDSANLGLIDLQKPDDKDPTADPLPLISSLRVPHGAPVTPWTAVPRTEADVPSAARHVHTGK